MRQGDKREGTVWVKTEEVRKMEDVQLSDPPFMYYREY